MQTITPSMTYRFSLLAIMAACLSLLTSCGSSGLRVLSKSAILGSGSYAKRESFSLPPVSTQTMVSAANKPKDKYQMPVYAFADRNRVVRTTAYTSTESDHLIYGKQNATGTTLRYNDKVRSAAADWSFYPVGTTFRIRGLPYLYVVDDYGSALLGTGTVDIYKPTKDIMNEWGRRTVEIQVIQWGSFTKSAELLSQRMRYEHCRKMFANIVRQQPGLKKVAM